MVDYIINLFSSPSTLFTSNGLGTLSDPISCVVSEEVNGEFELELEYPTNGMHYADLQMRRIIVTKSNPYSTPQAFRIYGITKPLNQVVTVNAHHISYDLSGYPVSAFVSTSIGDTFTKLKTLSAIPCPFTFAWNTTITNTLSLTVLKPQSIRSLLGGDILDRYTGEYEFDNYNVNLHQIRGASRGVSINYGKNLTDLKQEENCDSVYTAIYPYYYTEVQTDEAGVKTGGLIVLTQKIVNVTGTFDFVKVLPVDLTSNFETPPTQAALLAAANFYISMNAIGIPSIAISVSFAMLSQTDEYKDIAMLEKVSLCDTVTVKFDELGVSASAKCIKTVYNVITDKYTSCDLGDARSTIASTIVDNKQEVATAIQQSSTHFGAEIDTIKIGLADIEEALIRTITVEYLQAHYIDAEDIQATYLTAQEIATQYIKTGELSAVYAHITDGVIDNATIDVAKINNLAATYATFEYLNAEYGNVTELTADVADIIDLLAGNITAGNIKAGTIVAGSTIIADGAIGNAQIAALDAGKLNAGTLDTSKVTIQGTNGRLKISNNRMQVFEYPNHDVLQPLFERVVVGNVNGDDSEYGLRIRGLDGSTIMIDETGVHNEGITDGAITNPKIADDANIDGKKLDIASVITEVNGSETKILGSSVTLDNVGLDVAFSEQTNIVTGNTEDITQQSIDIAANAQGLTSKVESTDFDAATETIKANSTWIEQFDSSVRVTINNAAAAADANTDALEAMSNYFDFSSEGLVLGTSKGVNDNLKVRISPTAIDFLDNGAVIAYITNRQMMIDQAKILTSIQVGNHMIEKYAPDSSITLFKWVG